MKRLTLYRIFSLIYAGINIILGLLLVLDPIALAEMLGNHYIEKTIYWRLVGILLLAIGISAIRRLVHINNLIKTALSQQKIADVPKEIRVSIFPTRSSLGLGLAQDIAQFLEKRKNLTTEVLQEASMQDVMSACLTQDLVILDATREGDTDNYHIALEVLKVFPNVILVSRNYLPENVSGFMDWVYPTYWENSKDNREILSYIIKNIDSFLQRKAHLDNAFLYLKGRIEIDKEKLRNLRTKGTPVFISFRTKYQNAPGVSVAQLAIRIRNGAHGNDLFPRLVENGTLVYENEILTEQRRWYLLELLRDNIVDCDEFWIYGAPDHFDSWWTIGEFAVFLLCARSSDVTKRLKIYNPVDDTVSEVALEELPTLSNMQRLHLLHRLQLFNVAGISNDRRHVSGVSFNRKVAMSAQNPIARPVVWLWVRILYLAGRAYERKHKLDDLTLGMNFAEFFDITVSNYWWENVRSKEMQLSFWNQLEILIDNYPSSGEPSRGDKKFTLSVDFKRLFDFFGFERIAISATDLERGSVPVNGQTYFLRQEKPRFILKPPSAGDRLSVVDVFRFYQ